MPRRIAVIIACIVAIGAIAVPTATASWWHWGHHHHFPPPPTTTTTAPPVTTTTVPPTTTTTEPPTTTTTVPVSSAVYRGVGLVDSDCGDIATLQLTWYYDWGTTSPCSTTVPFVPMVWGSFSTVPSGLAANGNRYLLTFNEPDSSSQSNMTVAQALALWPQLEATGLELSTPAVTGSATGSAWLASFMAGVKADGYSVSFQAVHWYGDCTNPASLISYLNQMHSLYNLPIWLTEFSCWNDSLAENTTFAQEIGPMLAQLPYLQRVAWFTNRSYPNGYQNTNLIDGSGNLTTTGDAYLDWSAP